MRKKILIIEDDDDFRQIERVMLEQMGYQVIEAAAANEGIDLAIAEMPDLILMDIRLPYKKRGIGTARMLRGNEKTRGIPIIFVTAYAQGEYADEVRHIANCGYITKPFERSDFEKLVRKYIDLPRE
jgi:two-component system phosphate regulon response regulator PhoB